MGLGLTVEPASQAEWRAWLAENHAAVKEAWVIFNTRVTTPGGITYLEAVEEALCFGWVDGLAKKHDATRMKRRFTPRRPQKSNWTELNKERARRLIAEGRMHEAGRRVLPDLDPASFVMPSVVQAALDEDPVARDNFARFPSVYQRVRAGYVAEMARNPTELARRMGNLLRQTRENRMFGNWDDSSLLRRPLTSAR